MSDIEKLNFYRPILENSPNSDDIEELQHLIGCQLPKLLLDLLSRSNGGIAERSKVYRSSKPRYEIDRFFFIGCNYDENLRCYSIKETYSFMVSIGISDRLPFAVDGGGNLFYICLGSGPVGITFCDTNFHESIELSPSFIDFIDHLRS